jgi:hypothetical protein
MILIISTLPHYLAALPLMDNYFDLTYEYVNTIVAASTLSVLYHYYKESGIIVIIDYTAAFIWLLYDLYYAWAFGGGETFSRVVAANSLVLMLNWSIEAMNGHYALLHSIWHLLSATKCYYVSLLIKRAIDNRMRVHIA